MICFAAEPDPCLSYPCRNNGTCHVKHDHSTFECLCIKDTWGQYCQFGRYFTWNHLQNSQYYAAFVSVWPHIYSASSRSQTRSSPYVTLIKPSSSLKVTHRSFRHASPHLWNQLPTSLKIPHPNYSSPSQWPSFEHAGLTCYTLLSSSITFSLFHSELKTYLFRKSYPSS